MPLAFPLVVSALLFGIGVYGVLARRNAVLVLMGVELMLNAVNLNLLAFDAWHRDDLHTGQALTLFVITIAAAEIGLGLAIVLLVFRTHANVDVESVRDLADRDVDEPAATVPTAAEQHGHPARTPESATVPGAAAAKTSAHPGTTAEVER
jgi:NADH-quinone oxidoreductase subunit K